MAERNIKMRDIKGLTPSIEPTRSNELFALDGKNYVFDSRGPKSAFGDRLLLPHLIARPEHAQGIRLKLRGGDRCFTFTADSILEWDEVSGGWKLLYETPFTGNAPSRWTWGYLNTYVYFCHPRVGIVALNLDTNICVPLKRIGIGVPDDPLYIVINNGFLCVVTPILFAWSSPSNGLDFTPAFGGAGFQLISDRVSGSPIAVSSYTRGCLTWTTGGVMRSEFSGDQAVFRHRALQTEYRPVNPFCTTKTDEDTVVILTEQGLFQSKGEAPTPLTPLFNEFLKDYLQENDLKLGANVRIEWDELQRFIYISTSLTENNPLYENCFVLYPSLDKWGQFNQQHYGILPILIKSTERQDDYYGFVDAEKRVRYWAYTGSREVTPLESQTKITADLVYPRQQKPTIFSENLAGLVASSTMKVSSVANTQLKTVASYYPIDGNSPVIPERKGLDAEIAIGLIRIDAESSNDQVSEAISLMIRSLGQDKAFLTDTFNVTPIPGKAIDLNQSAEPRSYRFVEEAYINHKLTLIGTVDGETMFTEDDPALAGFVKAARYYTTSVSGIWHIVLLRAVGVGEFFRPVSLEITAIDGGRLN